MEIRFAGDFEWIKPIRGRETSPEEREIAVKERCKLLGLTYNGFIMPWKSALTKVSLTCPIHGNIHSLTVAKLVGKEVRGCPKCGQEKSPEERRVEVESKCKQFGMKFNGFVGEWKGKSTLVSITCPDHGEFQITITAVLSKQSKYLCSGCSSSVRKISEEVAIEKITERCNKKGYTFNGFVGGVWNGTETRLSLYCPTHGSWDSTTYEKFVGKSGNGCPGCGKLKSNADRKIKEEDAIKRIIERCNELGFEFLGFVGGVWDQYYTKLILRCPKHDNTWTTTVYGSFVGGKSSGCIKCRLEKSNKSRGFDPKKYEENILRICKEKNFEFLGWYGGQCENAHSRMILKCNKHNETWDTTTYTNFIRRPEMGCSQCTLYGFRSTRPAWIYVQDVAGKAIKFGITNRKSAEDRMRQQANKSGLKHTMIFSWHFEEGQKAYEIETAIKTRFKDVMGVMSREEMPDGFTETLPVEILPHFLKEVKSLCNLVR
ncbi:DUF723 domain-containing protein [Salmonella enterica]|nr:DUF723 domain-containing protein [Salmonella enterica]EEK5737684.1 DUF723 domain-containing protein [Salmonella enterica]EEL9952925.1 DUF723 domain-containing protein [Salmonella enterica]EEM1605863.1 DUF723 domain-containing protein [Salmonella enterica]